MILKLNYFNSSYHKSKGKNIPCQLSLMPFPILIKKESKNNHISNNVYWFDKI